MVSTEQTTVGALLKELENVIGTDYFLEDVDEDDPVESMMTISIDIRLCLVPPECFGMDSQSYLHGESSLPHTLFFSKQTAKIKILDIPKETSAVRRGVIHCYSGALPMAQDYVDMGFHIGIGGVVTFSNAKKTDFADGDSLGVCAEVSQLFNGLRAHFAHFMRVYTDGSIHIRIFFGKADTHFRAFHVAARRTRTANCAFSPQMIRISQAAAKSAEGIQEMYFESHAHYDDKRFREDREELLSTLLPASRVGTVINISKVSCAASREWMTTGILTSSASRSCCRNQNLCSSRGLKS